MENSSIFHSMARASPVARPEAPTFPEPERGGEVSSWGIPDSPTP
jgi:hypothetical protein